MGSPQNRINIVDLDMFNMSLILQKTELTAAPLTIFNCKRIFSALHATNTGINR